MEEDTITEFEDGPYNVINYSIKKKDGKIVIEQNQGDLGRVTLESRESVEKLRESLDKAEEYFVEMDRRKEDL